MQQILNTAKPKTNKKKILFYVFIAFVAVPPLIIAAFIGYILISFDIDKQRDEKSINAAASEIILPSQFQKIDSIYEDLSCLDVCANLDTSYHYSGSGPAGIESINRILESKGFRYQNESYTKKFENQDVDIFISADDSDASVIHVRIETDKDYLN